LKSISAVTNLIIGNTAMNNHVGFRVLEMWGKTLIDNIATGQRRWL
jgi:parallel beta-helix repeat protein